MVDRTFLLSHLKYHRDNFNFIIKTFLNNDYFINFIFDTINLRLRSLLKHHTKLVFISTYPILNIIFTVVF